MVLCGELPPDPLQLPFYAGVYHAVADYKNETAFQVGVDFGVDVYLVAEQARDPVVKFGGFDGGDEPHQLRSGALAVKPDEVVQDEAHPYFPQTELKKVLAETGMGLMAWAPLGQGGNNLFADPVLTEIGAQYGKSPAQVALRWLTQRGIVAIPKSTHRERMAQNLDIFDFSLTPADMQRIAALNVNDEGTVNFNDPNFIKFLIETYG